MAIKCLYSPVVFTPRLKLRQLTTEDFPRLITLANNPKISTRILNIPHPYMEYHAVHRMSYIVDGFKSWEKFVFIIAEKVQDQLIGELSIHRREARKMAELGYWIGEPFWNQGYATEAIARIVDFTAQHFKGVTLYATVDADNEASIRSLVKNGFEEQGLRGKTLVFTLGRIV